MFSSDKKSAKSKSPGSVETLADRIDTLAHAVSSTAATLAKRDGELVATRRALEARIGDLETYVTDALKELRAAAGAKPAKTRAEQTRREPIDGKLVVLGEQMTTLAAQLESLGTRLEATSNRIDANERELKSLALSGSAGGATAVLPSIDGEVQEVLDRLAAAADQLAAQQGRLEELEEAAHAAQAGVGGDPALAGRVDGFGDDLAAALARIDVLETSGSTAGRADGSAEADEALTRQLHEVVEGLATATARLDSQHERLASLETPDTASDEALRQRLTEIDDALAHRVREVMQGLTAATERIDAQHDEIAALRSEVAALPNDVVLAGAGEADAALIKRLDDVVEGLAVAADQLDAQQERLALVESNQGAPPEALLQRIDSLDAALARQVDDIVAGLSALADRVDGQQARIASLETASLETTGGSDESGLRERVEELDGALQALAAELPARAAGTGEHEDFEPRLAELGDIVLELRDAVAALDARVLALGADLDGMLEEPVLDAEEVERQLTETSDRFDAILSDLRNLTQMLALSSTQDGDELEARIGALRDSMALAIERIELLERDTTDGSDVSSTRVDYLEDELAALRARLKHTTSSDELTSHLDSMRLELAQAMTRLERTEDLATRTAYNTTSSTNRLVSTVDELRGKIEQVERMGDALLVKLDRAQMLWPVALRALEGRIEDIAGAREGFLRTDEQRLLADLHEGVTTAHAVLGEADGAPEHAGNGHPAEAEEPAPVAKTRRAAAKPRRTT